MAHRAIAIMLAILSLAALATLACGPATQPQQETPTVPATPTSAPTSPKPKPTPPESKPTPIPHKATPTPIPVKPTETPIPTLPPKPTETPLPTLPTPQQDSPATITFPPHPTGLSGCREYNMFGSSPEEVQYLSWCAEELSKYVTSVCNGLTTPEAQHACGKQELAGVSDYFTREGPIQCDAITESSHQQECFTKSYEKSAPLSF